MPNPPPVVRDLIVCEEIIADPKDRKRVTLVSILDRIQSSNQPPFPFRPAKLSAYARVTECRGSGTVRLEIQEADTDAVIYATPNQAVAFPDNPLAVHWMRFRIRDCDFPAPGLYWVRLLYDDHLLAQKPLVLC